MQFHRSHNQKTKCQISHCTSNPKFALDSYNKEFQHEFKQKLIRHPFALKAQNLQVSCFVNHLEKCYLVSCLNEESCSFMNGNSLMHLQFKQ